MASLVVGDIDHAREQALANLRVLANAVRDGYTVVCSEPTAALMLREEYIKLTEDLDAELVAAHTLDLGQYLLGLAARGQLPAPSRAIARTRRIPPALSSSGTRRRHAGPRAAAESPRAGRRVHRPRLLRHGRDLWTGARPLPQFAPRRPRPDEAASATTTSTSAPPNAAPAGFRWNRARQANAPSHEAPEPVLRIESLAAAALQGSEAETRHVLRASPPWWAAPPSEPSRTDVRLVKSQTTRYHQSDAGESSTPPRGDFQTSAH